MTNLAFCDTVFDMKGGERWPDNVCPFCGSKDTLKTTAKEWCERDVSEKTAESGLYAEKVCTHCGRTFLAQYFYSCTTWV